MLDLVLQMDHLLFANYLIPTRLLRVPQSFLLDKIIHRFSYHSYLSVVLAAYRGLRLNGHKLPLNLLQVNYRTYGRFYLKDAVYFLHSHVRGVPENWLQLTRLPLSSLKAETVIERRDEYGAPTRLRVDGSVFDSAFAVHLQRRVQDSAPENPQTVANLTGRELGVIRRRDGQVIFIKISHAPLSVYPAAPLLLSFPPIPELPSGWEQQAQLSSVWITGPTELTVNLPFSLALDAASYMVHRRLTSMASKTPPARQDLCRAQE